MTIVIILLGLIGLALTAAVVLLIGFVTLSFIVGVVKYTLNPRAFFTDLKAGLQKRV